MNDNPYEEMEAARGRFPNLHPPPKERKVPSPDNVAKGKWARNRGATAEREVVRRYVAHGYSRAHRQPMSGGMRTYGDARDTSPWPGDVGGVEPWLVEVKHSKYVDIAGRGWAGEAFVRRVLKDLTALWSKYPTTLPVLWARGGNPGIRITWRLWIPAMVFADKFALSLHNRDDWVEVTESDYWYYFAGGEDGSS